MAPSWCTRRLHFQRLVGIVYFRDMAGIDLATAQDHLTTWLAAEKAVASGQSYVIGNRKFFRANLKEVADMVAYWDGMVQRLSASGGQRGIRVRGATPVG